MTPTTATDSRQRRYDRHERRSDALACILGIMDAHHHDLPDAFEESVVRQLKENGVEQRPDCME